MAEEKKEEKVPKPVFPPTALKFERKEKAESKIPTASMPDIVFMLLLFFMVSTVFKEFTGLPVNLPEAKKIEKLKGRRNVAYIWVDKEGRISVNDKLISDIDQIATIMYKERVENPRVIVCLYVDREARMGIVNDIHQQLRVADALRITYSARPID